MTRQCGAVKKQALRSRAGKLLQPGSAPGSRTRQRPPQRGRPRIRPTGDPLGLWALEWQDEAGQVWASYHATRWDARHAKRELLGLTGGHT